MSGGPALAPAAAPLAINVPITDTPAITAVPTWDVSNPVNVTGYNGMSGTMQIQDTDGTPSVRFLQDTSGTNATNAKSMPPNSTIKLDYGTDKFAFASTDAKGQITSITTDGSAAAAKYTSSLPSGAFKTAAQKAQQADFMRDTFHVDVNEGYQLMNTEADVRTKNANAGYAEAMKDQALWSITRDKIQLGMQVGGMLLAVWDKVLQSAYLDHKMDLEDKMMTLAETKETNKYDLQKTLMEKESTLKDSAMKYDYKTAKLNAGTEKYKAKLAADVKKSKIKQDSIKDLFFRNQYPNGNTHYYA